MKLGIIFSNDWEVFGDGSGDYFRIQHRPLEELLETFDQYGAKLTIMAEVGQQWAHEELAPQETWAMDIVTAWQDILRRAVRRGHDVQLHLHPQWLGAERKDGEWKLRLDRWATGGLPAEERRRALARGKNELERLLQPDAPGYSCCCFRAGAYCIEPSGGVLADLLALGFTCDTSVTKGMFHPQYFDYRHAQSHLIPWYSVKDTLQHGTPNGPGLLELPIFSFRGLDSPILRKLLQRDGFYRYHLGVRVPEEESHWQAEREIFQRAVYPAHRRPHGNREPQRLTRWLEKLIRKTTLQLDYDEMPPTVFVGLLRQALSQARQHFGAHADITIPVMSSGHVKTMPNVANIERILKLIDSELGGSYEFWTARQAIDYWREVGAIRR